VGERGRKTGARDLIDADGDGVVSKRSDLGKETASSEAYMCIVIALDINKFIVTDHPKVQGQH
jgi:hypothetical protein